MLPEIRVADQGNFQRLAENRTGASEWKPPFLQILIVSGFAALADFAEMAVGESFVTLFVVAFNEGLFGFFAGDR